LVAFLADQRERLAPRTYGRYDENVDLLRPVSTTTGTRSSTKSNKLGWMPPRRVTRRHLSTCSDPTSSFPG
jgi:hypothetical protein